MSEQNTQSTLISAAMEIILHAGDARNHAKLARQAMREMNFTQAGQYLEEAKKEIAEAHRAQTEIIQNEARGIQYDYSMLFNHAQDTLMTINSEIELTADLILTFEVVMQKLTEKEG
ncbi:PTS lactose/cellobiose transporter subunit IIA [Holdemania massiliensis]|uniref:PTS lactose/cellobiose transporter subunit IIA n=1 Tax=Holdemania massiliensis TaxID=1468449 RepID=UPI001F068F69|nr:PTS lactose/cellobiose transporter subunit IIA [Holdemania massiliensis]MCH1939398.1 PTS lactose/cellobiose transporter subunit IIA [Holdemania massiliensis]